MAGNQARQPAAGSAGESITSAKRIDFDSRDTTILKGLAISAIVFHNFFHLVSPAPENEFGFHPDGFAHFLATIHHPSLVIQACFSFFGYLGVPVFIFLSAYGLTKSHWDSDASWSRFMIGRIQKLFPIFGLVILPWMIGAAFESWPHGFLRSIVPQIAVLFTGLAPLLPGLGLPPVGPWWFISFILEFYAIFFALRALTRTFGRPGLIVLALAGITISAFAAPLLAQWKIYLYETPFGRMPCICLGIAAARYSVRVSSPLVLGSLAVLVLGNEFSSLWPLTFAAALVLALWAYMEVRHNLRESKLLQRIGQCSLLIFLLNGIVRNDFLSFATTPILQLLFGAISAAVTFAIADTMQHLLVKPQVHRPDDREVRA